MCILCVCLVCACVRFLWMPVAHVHFSNLSDLCEPTAEEANTHAAFSITYNREFLPFHLTTTLTTHWVSHTHTRTHEDTHIHTESISQLSPMQHPPTQHLLFHKPQEDSNSAPVHLYICVRLKVCVCTLKSFLFPCKWNARRHNLKDYPKQRGRRKLKERNFEWKKKVCESFKVIPALSFWRL